MHIGKAEKDLELRKEVFMEARTTNEQDSIQQYSINIISLITPTLHLTHILHRKLINCNRFAFPK